MRNEQELQSVEEYKFEPIKGYPMLNWKGKRPYTSTQYYPAQLKETYGNSSQEWMNKIFWGDNLQVMSHLLRDFRGKIDLVYIDPPFDSKADYKKKISLKGEKIENDLTAFEEKQYTDIWSNDEYLQFLYERIILLRELMNENASIYIHCDYRRSHYIKLIMDEVFGADNFINEIIWKRTNAHNMKAKGYVRSNDHILFYSKGKNFTFNDQFLPYGEAQLKRFKQDENGDLYKAENLTFSSTNKNRQFEWRGATPPPNRSWGFSFEDLEKLWEQGRIICKKDGTPRMDGLKVYLDETKGTPVTCNWTDIARVGNTSSERLEYPTQKPEELIERIIKASSNEGDIVFDCFMGSGTTQNVSLKLNRKFIGADINLGAIQATKQRILKTIEVLNVETGFEVYNVNNYELFRNPVEAKNLLIEALEIQPLINSVYDGEKDGQMVKIMPINRIATKADLNNLITNLDYKTLEERQKENPNQVVENILLVCMGHEADLAATLKKEIPYKVNVEVVDILRDRANLEFKRDAEVLIKIDNNQLIIQNFYPMNLLQKLSIMKENVEDWKELVESVMIDWNYDGAILEPTEVDIPSKKEFVKGIYQIPENAGTIRVKITDLLSESLEVSIENE
ncbi:MULTISPECIES: site-specific DNA-methyltransferase [Bacillus cereus group]|uniref:site-specific DNA-methyltransferase n=1 Tax=Bacillus cereus group TaxID=86661 RepID=UPI0010393225|nr:site-specific DNA-methyltransferase [Bacillus wiedmannii]TCD31183.1 site-specific DNA-methyltransferase [Bacillus wiedmannii]